MAFNKQSSSSPSSANETANDSSEAAGTSAGRRETLAARAQRFIGKVLETEPTSVSDHCMCSAAMARSLSPMDPD